MDSILLASLIAFVVTFLSIPVLIRLAEIKHLYDVPDNRKLHHSPIPSLGGVGIFAGFIISVLSVTPAGIHQELQYLLLAFVIIFFLGLKDDIVDLTPLKKLIGQLIATGILIFKGDLLISGMHGFLGIYELNPLWSFIFTFFTFIVIINSFNLIDGVDGLAGSLGILSTLLFGAFFLFSGEVFYAILAFSLAGSLLAFLIYNVTPAKIFMGDTGSLLTGIINAILVVKFIEIASKPDTLLHFPSAPALGFAVLFIPLFDTLRIFSFRILKRRSPFSPDRNHVHHLLLDKGFNHPAVTAFLLLFNLVVILLTYTFRSVGNSILLISLVSVGFCIIGLLFFSGKKKKKEHAENLGNSEKDEDLKVINLRTTNEGTIPKEQSN
jgi:UDP-N-acetylmuramyl pentapeptide phosphotransferase/UDP-N-acetylglucosamine-1-phosphate transferase